MPRSGRAFRRGIPLWTGPWSSLRCSRAPTRHRRPVGRWLSGAGGTGSHRRDPRLRGRTITALVVDAGPLYAYVDADDAHHAATLELLETPAGPLLVPTLVSTEVVYLLATRLGTVPEVRFLGDLAGGSFTVEPVAAADWLRIAELVARYRDLPLGTVDDSVVATAERLGIKEIATVDRRRFSVVRPARVDTFTLLPSRP